MPVGFVLYFRAKGGSANSEPERRNEYIDLYWILVHPKHRQKGVGSALISSVCELGKQEWPNVNAVRLYVMESNTKALSLYKNHGFEILKRRENYPEIGVASTKAFSAASITLCFLDMCYII